ncbi:hypothetical protein V6N13_029901 [Hibiscus sabdariffa]
MLPNGDSVEGHHPGFSRKASESSFCPTEDEDDDKDDESLRRWKEQLLRTVDFDSVEFGDDNKCYLEINYSFEILKE